MASYLPKSDSDSGSVFFDQKSFSVDLPSIKLNNRKISKSKLREYRDAFSLFDKDGNGYLTKEELGHVMHQLGQWARMEELQEMLAEIDTDGDGNVSFEEFVEILLNMTNNADSVSLTAAQEEQELRDAFRVFDKHNRGYITASDLTFVLKCLGEDLSEEESKFSLLEFHFFFRSERASEYDGERKIFIIFSLFLTLYFKVEDMIKEVDVDGDGRIDFDEFVYALGEPEDSQDEDQSDDEEGYTSPEPPTPL